MIDVMVLGRDTGNEEPTTSFSIRDSDKTPWDRSGEWAKDILGRGDDNNKGMEAEHPTWKAQETISSFPYLEPIVKDMARCEEDGIHWGQILGSPCLPHGGQAWGGLHAYGHEEGWVGEDMVHFAF
jgi:hypothetical protein